MSSRFSLNNYHILLRVIAFLLVLECCLVFFGWSFDITVLKSILPGLVAMNPLTALCFLCAGISLLGNRMIRRACASFLLLVGLVKIFDYVLGTNLSLDQVLFSAKLEGNQIAPNTAMEFLFVGAALLLMETKNGLAAGQFLNFIALIIAWTALLGYFYSSVALYRIGLFIPMAVHTAISFICLCAAIFCLKINEGLTRHIVSDDSGGIMARRLIPAVIVIPSLLGWLKLIAQEQGLIEVSSGTALVAVGNILLFGILIWMTTRSISLVEEKHRKTEEARMRLANEVVNVKSEFISVVSHELRTPLTVIKGGIDVVADETLGPLNHDQKDMLDTTKRNVDRLGRLINDVLDFQKLEAGRMVFNFAEHDLNEVVKDTVEEFQAYIKECGLGLQFSCPQEAVRVICDSDKIVQVLTNLLNNAIKFTNKGVISVGIQVGSDGHAKVSVQDQGVGIKLEDKEKLFQTFSQVGDAQTRKTGSSGLGLAIVKRIIEKHDGIIDVESVYGQGSTFYFTLPLKQ